MPPKKKDDKKKEEQAEPDDGAERELVEKELVIGYLKSKLGRYQEHGDQLQIENIKLTEDLEAQKLNLRDINEFLTNELKARSLTSSALEAKVYELNNLLEEARKGHEGALNRLRAEKDRESDNLRTSLADYERKAKAMQDFLDRKDAMEAELAACKAELASKVKDYEYRLTDLDRSHIQDREKWKRETMQKIKETKIQMMKLTDNQLEMTTKRTIMENVQMSIELQYQSRQTEKLMNKNIVLLEENQDLRQQLSLSKQTQEELARRNNVYQKTIKSLLSKLKEQGDQQEASQPMIKALEERIADLELSLHLSTLQSQEQQHQLETVQQRLKAARAVNDTTAAAQDATVKFLTTCLEDVRGKIVTMVSHDTAGPERASSNFAAVVDEDGGHGTAGSSGLLDGAITARSEISSVAGGPPPKPHVQIAGEPSAPELRFPAGITIETGRLEELSAEQRERVLSYLLEKMHVFMHEQALAATAAEHAEQRPLQPASSARFGRRASSRVSSQQRHSMLMDNRTSHGSISLSMHRQSVASQSLPPTGAHVEGLQHSHASPSASWPAPETAVQPGQLHSPPRGAIGTAKPGVSPLAEPVASLPLPAVDDLLLQVMADVRPWGKKTADSALVAGGPQVGPGRNAGVFVKQERVPAAGRRKA